MIRRQGWAGIGLLLLTAGSGGAAGEEAGYAAVPVRPGEMLQPEPAAGAESLELVDEPTADCLPALSTCNQIMVVDGELLPLSEPIFCIQASCPAASYDLPFGPDQGCHDSALTTASSGAANCCTVRQVPCDSALELRPEGLGPGSEPEARCLAYDPVGLRLVPPDESTGAGCSCEDCSVDAQGCADVQVDGDGDGRCDPGAPSTGPRVCQPTDNCAGIYNSDQADLDLDGIGDVCDDDLDGDGTPDTGDCFPWNAGTWEAPGELQCSFSGFSGGIFEITCGDSDATWGPDTDVRHAWGDLATLRATGTTGDATCTFVALGGTASVPDPAPGQNLYWIWEAANACGGGGSAPFNSCP